MMGALSILLFSSVASAAPDAEAVRVLVMDLRAEGASPQDTRNVTALVAVQLGEDRRLEVVAGEDLRRIADLEADRQALGCEADTSCLAELAGALDAEYVVYGQVGGLGSSLLVTLNLFDVRRGRAAGRASLQVTDAALLPQTLAPRLRALWADVMQQRFGDGLRLEDPGGAVVAARAEPSPVPMVITGTGAVLVAVGAGLLVLGLLPQWAIAGAQDRYASDPAGAAADARGWQEWYPAADYLYGGGVLTTAAGGLVTLFGAGLWALQ
jgi:hypothetical protein